MIEAGTGTGSGRRLTVLSQQGDVPLGLGLKSFSLSPVPPPLCWVPEATAAPSPYLPDVVQKLWGGEAILGAGELVAIVLEEGQQVGLQGKEPAGQGTDVNWRWRLSSATPVDSGCSSKPQLCQHPPHPFPGSEENVSSGLS